MMPAASEVSLAHTRPMISRDEFAPERLAGAKGPRPRPRVSVIIPALNEAANLPYVLPRIPPWVTEVVLVDGHSTDGTPAIAGTLAPGVCVLAQRGVGKG